MSTLYEEWLSRSRDQYGRLEEKFWKSYMQREQAVYENLLASKTNTINTTVTEFAELHDMQECEAAGFFDGIVEALNEELDIENLEAATQVNVSFEFENLFKKMVEYKAKHLYSLPQWNDVINEEEQKRLMKEQQKSGTIVKDKKVSRNDPCPCDSGKKYKKCCGLDD